MKSVRKKPLILRSNLTSRYYVTQAYKMRAGKEPGKVLIEVTGRKWDVTDQMERLIDEARERDGGPGMSDTRGCSRESGNRTQATETGISG